MEKKGVTATILVKCSCGHTWREKVENLDIDATLVVTRSLIEGLKISFDYTCPNCGKTTHAVGYFK